MRFFLAVAAVLFGISASFAGVPGWNGAWIKSTAGGTSIELPSFLVASRDFMENGTDYGTAFDGGDAGSSFWLHQYWSPTAAAPGDFILSTMTSDDEITYRVIKDDWAVFSGFHGAEAVFYDICRQSAAKLDCLEMGWNKAEQKNIGPLVTRIVKSFRHQTMDTGL